MMLQSNISFVSWLSSIPLCVYICFPGGTSDKASACQCKRLKRHGFNPWVGKIPRGRKWQPTLILSPGKFHGRRTLAGYSPWGYKESYITVHRHACAHATRVCTHMQHVCAHTYTHTHTPQFLYPFIC